MMNLQPLTEWRATRPLPHLRSVAPQQHLGQLLHSLSFAFEQLTLAKCHQRGHRKFRNSHSAVITQLDDCGLCLGDLAERIGISQQATGKLVRDLERAGYLCSQLDIRDKRSRIIRLTAAGQLLQSDLGDIFHEVREEFARILGASDFRRFEQLLKTAANALF